MKATKGRDTVAELLVGYGSRLPLRNRVWRSQTTTQTTHGRGMPSVITPGNPPHRNDHSSDPPAADRRVEGTAPGNTAAAKSANQVPGQRLRPTDSLPVNCDHLSNSQTLRGKPGRLPPSAVLRVGDSRRRH